MRLAMIQMNVVRDKQENLTHAWELLRQAARRGLIWPCCRRCSAVPIPTAFSAHTAKKREKWFGRPCPKLPGSFGFI